MMIKEKEVTALRKPILDISSAALHIIAMISMLIDHVMKTVVNTDSWVFVLGRLAFPIFAFMAAEGYFHTRSYSKYILRMLIFAVVSEIPYDLMKSGTIFDPYDQNVMWTFLLALLCIKVIDLIKSKWGIKVYIPAAVLVSLIGLTAGSFLYVDYGGMGVLMVMIFYFFRERKWQYMLIQLLSLAVINIFLLGALEPMQGFALLSLIPILLYHGRQGYHSKPFQYACYAFYPVHMIILVMAAQFVL